MSQMTKKALAASLKELMEEKPLYKITVKDITERCEINRHTFYYHFKDIYDLVEWIYTTETERALGGPVTYENCHECAGKLLNYALENKKFILGTYRGLSKEYLLKYFVKQAGLLIGAVVEEVSSGMKIPADKKTFVTNFYSYAFVGIFMSWVENDMKEKPEHILSMVLQMIQEDLRKNLERFSEK